MASIFGRVSKLELARSVPQRNSFFMLALNTVIDHDVFVSDYAALRLGVRSSDRNTWHSVVFTEDRGEICTNFSHANTWRHSGKFVLRTHEVLVTVKCLSPRLDSPLMCSFIHPPVTSALLGSTITLVFKILKLCSSLLRSDSDLIVV